MPQQILPRIVRLLADGNSQRESSEDDEGVSRIHKKNCAMQPRDWPTTSEEAWRFDKNLHAKGRLSTAPNGQNESPHLGSSSANADDPPIWEEPDVPGSLWSTGDATVSWRGGTECGTSDNGDTVSSVMSPGSPYTTVTVGSGCAPHNYANPVYGVAIIGHQVRC